MKKLIAIIITLIFILEGAGYCLRVPLYFEKAQGYIDRRQKLPLSSLEKDDKFISAVEFLKSIGVKKGINIANLYGAFPAELYLAAAYLGAYYTGYVLSEDSHIVNMCISDYDLEEYGGSAKCLKEYFLPSNNPGPDYLEDNSQDIVLIPNIALPGVYPEFYRREKLQAVFRIIKSGGSIITGGFSYTYDNVDDRDAGLLMNTILNQPGYKNRIKLENRRDFHMSGDGGNFYEFRGTIYDVVKLERPKDVLADGSPGHPEVYIPLDELTWEDEKEAAAYFRAFLAKLKISCQKPLTIEALKRIAISGKGNRDVFPKDYYEYLLKYYKLVRDIPEMYCNIRPFMDEFNAVSNGTYWFRHTAKCEDDQIENICTYVKTLPEDQPIKILIHAVWNGEDAYSIALMLNHLYPDRKFEITGIDIRKPDNTELSWVDNTLVPDELKEAIPKYFIYKTADTLALQPGFLSLVALRQGDIRDSTSFDSELDIFVANRILGAPGTGGLRKEADILKAIENIYNSLKPGGLFYAAYYRGEMEQSEIFEMCMQKLIDSGRFVKLSPGVYEKVKLVKVGTAAIFSDNAGLGNGLVLRRSDLDSGL